MFRNRHAWIAAALLTASTTLGPAQAQEAQEPVRTLPAAADEGGTTPRVSTGIVTHDKDCCGSRGRFWSRWGCWKTGCINGANEGAVAPLGASLYAHGRTQVGNGVAARMVLYDCDFLEGTDKLNLRGRDQLAKIAGWLPRYPFPVVVERTPCQPGLDEARRQAVAKDLAVAAERVVVGPPIANGLSGPEAEIIYGRFLENTRDGGRSQSGGGTILGFSPSSFGLGGGGRTGAGAPR